MSWSSGYVTEVDYVFGYYPELHPGLLQFACIHSGYAPPPSEPLHYLELGYGQGLCLNVHAAALPGVFWGSDFNPSQVAHARMLARASGSGAILLEDSFSELATREDVPEFDIIALHGIWTWVSDDNRRTIVDIVRRKLKVGGVLYNSYNSRPGWAPAEPLRQLMTLYSELAAPAAGTVANVDSALKFCQQLLDGGALYFKANPLMGERLTKLFGMNRNYLAHEYFNRNWEPMTFSQMVDWLDPAKVTYVASAHLLDHVDSINLPDVGKQLLANTPHPVLRETIRDYFVNQQFRRDIFIKGPQRLSRESQIALLKSQSFVLITAVDDVPMTVTGALSEATLQAELYRPLIEALAANNYEPKSLGELAIRLSLDGPLFGQLVQGMLVLTGAGHASPARAPSKEARRRCAALNRQICERALGFGDINYLASPVSGCGLLVTRLHQLFLWAMDAGQKTVADQASYVWKLLQSQGQAVLKDGKSLETADESVAELSAQAQAFHEKRLPILMALGVSISK